MKRKFLAILAAVTLLIVGIADAQIDSTLLKQVKKDTTAQYTAGIPAKAGTMNMDAAYQRSFVKLGGLPLSVGGYMEGNWQHLGTDGVTEGHQFQFRRFTLFFASSLSNRIRFMAELEFEDGAKEISVEFAVMDVEFSPLLNLRGGIILNPIGGFNQNHDGPKWEFVDRPVAATQMLPSTWNNAGFGLYGKHNTETWTFGYEFYVSGGFDNSIIANTENKTFLPAAKENPDRFEETASGEPLITGKAALRNSEIGELGLSFMGGVYNRYQDDGILLDDKRRCDVVAVDFNTELPAIGTRVLGEWAWVFVDVPRTYTQQFGRKQQGGFADIVHPVWKGEILGWPSAVLNVACRFEYLDWNMGKFRETGGAIGDDLWRIMPAMSFRPTSETVIRLNYVYQRQRDILGNPPATTAGFIFGISTYF